MHFLTCFRPILAKSPRNTPHGRWEAGLAPSPRIAPSVAVFLATDAIAHRSRSQSDDLALNEPSSGSANSSSLRLRTDQIRLTSENEHVEMAQLLCVLRSHDFPRRYTIFSPLQTVLSGRFCTIR